MSASDSIRAKLRSLFLRKRAERELDIEMRYDIEHRTQANIAAGMTVRDAKLAALREFGSVSLAMEECRDARGTRWLDQFSQDTRLALRTLRRNPGFTLAAVLTLALGIGATSAIFSVINAVFLKSLPYRQPERLMLVQERIAQLGGHPMGVSAPDVNVMQRDNRVFESLAAFHTEALNLSGVGQPLRVPAARVSAALFPMLGGNPVLGRTFSPDEDAAGHFVAVLSYGLWQAHFGGDEAVLGKTILLDAQPYTIVGVMPAGFEFAPRGMPNPNAQSSELWIPIAFTPADLAGVGDNFDIGVIGRLKAGVSLAQARADMNVVAGEVLKTWIAAVPEVAKMNLTLEAPVTPLQQAVVGPVRKLLYLLLAAVGFLLLIACANVANLLLSRGVGRQREITVRAALGAGRGRIARQLLTESVILACFGGVLGLLLSVAGTRALAANAPDNIPQVQGITVDGTVLIFALLLSLITGVFFGLVPAFAAGRVNLSDALKTSARAASAGRDVLFARSAFVVAQVSVAFLLIVAGGLLLRSFVRAEESGAGVQPHNVITAAFAFPAASYADASRVNSFFQNLFARLHATQATEAVGAATDLPTEMEWDHIFTVENHPAASPAGWTDCAHSVMIGDYFRAIGVQLIAGRFFTPEEEQGKSSVVIISAGMAKTYFSGEAALGKRIKWGPPESKSPWLTIVGVVNDVKHSALDEAAKSHTYAPYLQDCAGQIGDHEVCGSLNIAMRAYLTPAAAADELRSAVAKLDSSLPATHVRTLDRVLQSSIAPRRFNTFLLSIFASAALFLAAMGLYSVLAYRVSQQTHEIGIRVALGASAAAILYRILMDGAKLVFIGLFLGAAAALALTRLMQSLLYDVSATDPVTFVGVALLLLAVAFAACYLPARRAMRVDPCIALRAG